MNIARLSLLLGLLAVAPGARAASCQVGASDLAFGNYSAGSANDVDSSATIMVQGCVDDGTGSAVSYSIEIGPGLAGNFASRAMNGPGGQLYYNLYVDPARSLVWGDGTGGSLTVSDAFVLPLATSSSHVAYGRIPANQSVSAGTYVDTLTVLISY
jgi:spore coat protein U-like protein